jgi:hypothetical protein
MIDGHGSPVKDKVTHVIRPASEAWRSRFPSSAQHVLCRYAVLRLLTAAVSWLP